MIGRLSTVFLVVLACVCCQMGFAREQQSPELAGITPATPAIVGTISVTPRPDGLTIEIAVSAPVLPETLQLANPDRLVFDFPGCQLQGSNRHIPVNTGPVRELRVSLFSIHPPVTRVVVDSKEPLAFQMKPAGNKVEIDITFANALSKPAVTPRPPVPAENEPIVASAPPPKPPEAKIAIPKAESRPRAYGLQAKAKALSVEELQSLEDHAKAGDPEAETTLALAYHAGVLLRRDDEESVRLLRKAADQGFMAAQESLGIFSESGIGMDHPAPAEALDWYKKAVRQGSIDAATNIALMYADGRGVPKNPEQAVTWFRRAAEGGDGAAQYNLALAYGRGDGVSQDSHESVRWLTAAADQNVVPALLDLGDFYMHPTDSTPADIDRAIRYYEKAASLGSDIAPAILGNIYANGLQGTPGQTKPDYYQAVKWYRMAADRGQRYGQFGLGVRYQLGQGVPVDLLEARRLFTAAAEQGQPDAQYDLGSMCEEGKGAPADRAQAAHYYQLAADQGLAKAQFRLGRLLASTGESGADRISAYKWLTLAQESIKGSSEALSVLKKNMNLQEIAQGDQEVDQWRIAHAKNRQ